LTLSTALLSFLATVAILVVTPGLDTTLVLRTGAIGGTREALKASFGVVTGCLMWGGCAAFGLGALLVHNRIAFDCVRVAGALYLVVSGAKLLVASFTPKVTPAVPVPFPETRNTLDSFVRGLLQNILNPKIGMFYLSLLPQFVPTGVRETPFLLMLAIIQAGLSLGWLAALSFAGNSIGHWMRIPRVAQMLDRITGVLFIGFGVRLAASR